MPTIASETASIGVVRWADCDRNCRRFRTDRFLGGRVCHVSGGYGTGDNERESEYAEDVLHLGSLSGHSFCLGINRNLGSKYPRFEEICRVANEISETAGVGVIGRAAGDGNCRHFRADRGLAGGICHVCGGYGTGDDEREGESAEDVLHLGSLSMGGTKVSGVE